MKKQLKKVTPEVYKRIKELVPTLPKMPKVDKHGKPVYKPVSTREISPDGKKYRNVQSSEPRFLNHEVELVNAYQIDGDAGIEFYCTKIREYAAKFPTGFSL